MSTFKSILPNNSTAFERNLERSANFPSLPIAELSDLVNPWKIDARYLAFLAYRFAIEIWQDNWGEERKRSVIARALELQRIKGTSRGLREYVKLVDADVKQIIVPPQYFWTGNGLSEKTINEWHESLPQLRIYFARETMKKPKGLSFIGHCFVGHNLFASGSGLGRALNGRKARLWDRGKQEAGSGLPTTGNGNNETPLKLIGFETINQQGKAIVAERVSLPGLAGKSAFLGHSFFDSSFLQSLGKKPQILTWNREIAYIHPAAQVSTTSLNPSLKPLDLRASRKSDKWQDKYCAAAGRFISHCFLKPSYAEEKLYDCLPLHDPKRGVPRLRGLSFLGVSRLGQPAMQAKALIDLQMKAHPKAFFANIGFLGRHVIMEQDTQKREGVRRAIVLSKAVRDKILITHQTSRPLTFGDGIGFDGGAKFNSRIKNRI